MPLRAGIVPISYSAPAAPRRTTVRHQQGPSDLSIGQSARLLPNVRNVLNNRIAQSVLQPVVIASQTIFACRWCLTGKAHGPKMLAIR